MTSPQTGRRRFLSKCPPTRRSVSSKFHENPLSGSSHHGAIPDRISCADAHAGGNGAAQWVCHSREHGYFASDCSIVLSSDAEFLCFDDRFLIVTSLRDGQRVLFDSQSQRQLDQHSHPELNAPGGLLDGSNSCNGYYTRMMGPGLLHDNGEWPVIPSCESVNTGNVNPRDRNWLNRPCAVR